MIPSRTSRHRWAAPTVTAILASAGFGVAIGADTDIATAPLFTSSNSQVKPNLMFILDDSGSMAWDFLPVNFAATRYGKRAAQCNGIAYNPSINYLPPTNADGTSRSNASLSVITDLSNPTTQTTSQRAISGTVTMPATLTGTMSFTVTGSDFTATTYQSEETVTIFQNGDGSRFFTGEVVSWTRTTASSGTLVVDISGGFSEGTGSFSAPRVGKGQPNSPFYFRYVGDQKPLGFTYDSNGVITTTTFYQECNSTIGTSPGSGVFNQVNVTTASAEAQNYANWATYFSTRMKLMQAGVSRAFANIDNRYRVGYTTINERSAASGTNFLDIRDFDATQKSNFYTKLFAATPGNATPLRGALAKAGQYYANKASGQAVDPIQYSCQRNFTILSTDGYWNTGSESTSTPKYGPYGLDNINAVGQQDGAGTLRPMHDGETATVTTTQTWTRTQSTDRQVDTVISSGTVPAGTDATLIVSNESGGSEYRVRARTVDPFTGEHDKDGVRITRSGTTITVTGIEHDFLTGDRLTVTSGSNSSFRASNVPITRLSQTSFSYTGNGSSGSAGGDPYTFTPQGFSCPSGQSFRRQLVEVRNVSYTLRKTATLSGTTTTTRVLQTESTTTPVTRTTVVTDGVQTSDNETTGTPTTTTTTTSTTVLGTGTFGPSSITLTSSPVTVGDDFTLVPETTVSGCSASAFGSSSSGSVSSSSPTASVTVRHTAFTGTSAGTPTVAVLGSSTTESARTTNTPATTTTGGTTNTLADVAMYYYKTDLRDSTLGNCTGALNSNICLNNVPGNAASAQRSFGDAATWQHMTTYTLGLGVGGILTYDPNYLTQTSGDFIDILNRTKNWPVPGGTKGAENTDDLWHAAVNGRGQYFSAGDPNTLATALTGALDAVKAITGAAAAASTSSLQPVQGDNDVFVAQFTTATWIGDVLSYRIDPNLGTISSTAAWSAKEKLDAKAYTTRNIYYPRSGALRRFTYGNLTADGFNGFFDSFCAKTGAGGGLPTQCAGLSGADLIAANSGANLVDYLAGNQTLSYYRTREAKLGDIISASPLFVGKPQFKYTENGYAADAATTAKAGRTAVVLSAANDGMVHAFDRITGEELWAFMPSFVLPNLYKLADNNYGAFHSFFVDGSPQMGDIYVPSGPKQGWRTIVVGGLNAGGKGYYALDVTNPAAPEFLWEFTHPNLGLTFGNPIITKRSDGTWVVAFTSGYNNNTGGGDGNGHLFILDAFAGTLITSIPTMLPDGSPAGTVATPSGLSKLNVWVNAVENNTAERFYAGDLQGNLWRFDLDGKARPFGAALQLAKLTAPDGTAQSVTTRPNLAEVSYNGNSYPTVFVATGRYLGTTDSATTTVQSVYAIKDPLADAGWGTVRTGGSLVPQTVTASTNSSGQQTRVLDSSPVDWGIKAGWRLDLPGSGERVTVNPQLSLNTLTVGSILPNNSVCTVGGESFLYRLDITSIGSDGTVVGTYVGNVLIQGLTNVQLADGSVVTITTRSDASLQTNSLPPTPNPANLKRTSWRELID